MRKEDLYRKIYARMMVDMSNYTVYSVGKDGIAIDVVDHKNNAEEAFEDFEERARKSPDTVHVLVSERKGRGTVFKMESSKEGMKLCMFFPKRKEKKG